MNHAVGHVGHRGVVRDDDGERAEFAIHALDRFEHDDAGADVERAGGFIAEEHFGAFRDRARDGHALLFAAGKLRGEMVHPRREAHEIERGLGRHRVPRDLGDEADVFAGGEARDKVVELKNETHGIAAVEGEFVFVSAREVGAAVTQLARSRHIEAAELVEQGGLAAAGGAEEHDELARAEVEVDAGERAHLGGAGAVGLGEPAHVEDGFTGGGRSGESGCGGVGGHGGGESRDATANVSARNSKPAGVRTTDSR